MKSRYLLILLILLSYQHVGGQTHIIDSLKQALKTERDDSDKVNALNTLSSRLCRIGRYDTSMTCANSAQNLAEKVGFKKGLAEAYNNMGVVCENKGNYPKALDYEFMALKMDEEMGYKRGIAMNTGNIGNIYKDQGNFPQALEYGLRSVKMYEEIGDKRGVALNTGNIGNTYYEQGDYPKTLEYYFKALKMDEERRDTGDIVINLGNIGLVYKKQGDYPNALDYDFKALKMNEKIGDKNGIAINTGNIGNAYSEQGDYPKALEYFFKALKMDEESGYKRGIAINTSNIGNAYSAQAAIALSRHNPVQSDSLYKKALEYYFRALKMKEAMGDKKGISITTGDIGNVFTKQKNYRQAKAYLDSALFLAKNIRKKETIKTTYNHLAEYDSSTGNYKQECDDYKNYIIYRDSLINEDNTRKSTQTEMNFEFEQRETSQKAEQDKKDVLAQADKRKQQIIIWSVAGGLLLVLVFAGFIFRSLNITRKQKDLIGRQKAEVEQQKALVEEKNKDILDSITYAKRLQDAILPPMNVIKKYLPESFVLYKPKDIVAGDFYWLEKVGDTILIAAADCTGHGVPGAMVSVVCSNALNRAVKEFHITEPGKILDKTRELVLETFEKSEGDIKDGMDISLCCINTSTREIKWSGAYNPLWYIQAGEVKEVNPDKQPIGKVDAPQPFHTNELKLNKGDLFYLFTDGYADQFGGPKGKKFKYKQLSEKLSAICGQPMEEQKRILAETLESWKGNLEQVDDILVIGIRV
jgi:tetratricopeptide (TPR) repeat protein